MKLILASASIRRAEILRDAGFSFTVMSSTIDETPYPGESAHVLVERLAVAKAELVAARATGPAIVIGADTEVTLEGHIFGKPRSSDDARHMLERLSGRTHAVLTGVALIRLPDAERLTFVESTLVHFAMLSAEEIDRYLATGEPHDKAGGYGIQGRAGRYIPRIEGCYFNVVGLPLVAPGAGAEQHKLIGRPMPVTFVTEDVIAKYREWSKRGVRFQFAPRLKRLKYEVHVRASHSPDPSAPGAEHAPIWGGVFTRFRDLDGNSFSLVSFDEVTHAVEAQRRALAEKLESERRAAQEIEIAKQVQARLFPQTLPPLKTLEYSGLCIQARKVGGDYYDFLNLGRGRLGFVIRDISGKGIAAALLTANHQANLRSQCALALDQPQRLLCSVNQLFCDNTPDGSFATLFFAEYDNTSSRLR